MRTRAVWAFAACVLIATLLAAAPGEKPRTAWEYKFLRTENGPSEPTWNNPDAPNALGAEGWELVSATADRDNMYVLYKRAK